MKSDEWDAKSIVSIGEVITGNTPSKEDEQNWGGDFVWITAQDFKNKYITTSTLKLTKQGKDKSRVIPENSVLVTCIASIGLNGINKVQCATNQQINAVVCNAENYFEFIYYAITYNNNRLKNLAGQTAVPIINKSVFENFTVAIPKDQKEQQKIADCLSSLDDLITAENQKLETLKAHKKGLMQNLFPAEGEKIPQLRFKEFENSGEWDNAIIGAIAHVSTGGTPDSTNPEYWNGDIPWMNSGELNNKRIYSVSNFITLKGLNESSTKLIPPYCVLIGLAGQGKTRGTAAINYIELCTNQSIAAIHPNKDIFYSEFMYHKIDSLYEQLRALSAGDGGRGGLNLQIIKAIELQLPTIEEQQKVADCLSSLDEQIETQNQKIETLKLHKKGLMQGLFPNVNEVSLPNSLSLESVRN
jgi:type I restriction enzyme S subunit